LLVAADGSASAVRSLLRAPVTDFSYGQHAVVTHVVTEKPHAETAWQRFLPGGPLAFLPLTDGRSSVVWSTPSEQAEALLEEPEDSFLRELQVASGGVLGAFESVAGRASFPLRAAHVRRYAYPRVALVGDAAHTVHPLAGQGMNLGLLDAAALAEVLEQAVAEGQDAGDLRVLRGYERRRKGGNLKMLLALDGLHRVFRLTGPVLPRLRALGMSAVDATPLAKRFLMREALALGGDLPSAARARVA
jgi:2-octaprenylphenol hydroxylase